MCFECDRRPDLNHEHSWSSSHMPETGHTCPQSGEQRPDGSIPVKRKATSDCCGAKLAEGGTPETGFTCTGCGKPCERVMSDRMAHWTCPCETRIHQVLKDWPPELLAARREAAERGLLNGGIAPLAISDTVLLAIEGGA